MSNPQLFDLAGNHWLPHGSGVTHRFKGDVARKGARLDVYSYYQAIGSARSVQPYVLVNSMENAFAVSFHLVPADARTLAAALLSAADRADQVAQALKAGGAA